MTAQPRRSRAARAVVAVSLALAAPATAAAQTPAGTPAATAPGVEQLAGLTADGQLVLFRSDSPGNLQGAVTVSGLQQGEKLLGLDSDPTTGRIYALGSSNRVYTVDPTTGAATSLSNTPFSPPLNGQSFTFAIDTVADQARVVSNSGQNLRVSVVNGQVAGVDAPYQYESGDPGVGTTPALSALAYTTPPSGGGGAPSLYGIETARDVLVSSATNAATLRTIGALGVDAGEPAALDITSTGTAFAALRPGGVEFPMLYTVNLSTGAATPVSTTPARATIAYRVSSTATQDTPIMAMTSLGAAPADETKPRVSIAVSSTQLASRLLAGGLQFTVACNEACATSGQATVAGVKLNPVSGSVLSTAGNVRLTVKLSAAAKAALRKSPTARITLKVTTTDAAGNAVSTTRLIRGRVG